MMPTAWGVSTRNTGQILNTIGRNAGTTVSWRDSTMQDTWTYGMAKRSPVLYCPAGVPAVRNRGMGKKTCVPSVGRRYRKADGASVPGDIRYSRKILSCMSVRDRPLRAPIAGERESCWKMAFQFQLKNWRYCTMQVDGYLHKKGGPPEGGSTFLPHL